MRIGVRAGATFQELLTETRRMALRAYEHQEAPFERVVEKLSPERRLDRTPVFQVLFALQPLTDNALDLAGLEVTPFDLTEVRARFDVELHVLQGPARTVTHWVYDEALFDRDRIAHMAAEYAGLLEHVVRHPEAPVDDLKLSRPSSPGVPGTGDTAAGGGEPPAPLTSGQASYVPVLAPLFAEVLGLPEVDAHDNFFALGGHSLMAMSLAAKIEEALGFQLAVQDIFAAPSVAELAAHLGGPDARR